MSIKILIVDDEPDFIETMVKRFTFRKMPVTAAKSGIEALTILETEAFDVVIMDVRMPGKDGIETLKEIKKHHPLTEVIMLTGHASVESGMRGMSLGAYDYVLKPVDFDELLDKVRKAHERKQLNEGRRSAQ
ncbi:sigma-54-dependent transcriptional regulator [Desulfolutivibrio sulfoxidireducens]|uniref:sigma-54-dependent transcriptional regulator n=1 Tax=Desulfolutivibrio sulfoxidireducens TaxID=2773299 RepID=UPI00159E1794|nr:response regulator [Desulfolutivibrio sulfoxidireducens]QLA17590.1 response regulator [Desulfolutivibrio sulfoxidireducens]QLA21168.1 response regulator [Desulfolutivibrio sulfoxidireducens]